MPLVQLVNINKTYQLGNQQVHAVHNFSLSIDRGEFIALAGPSGSGKTTILNLIGCLDKPSSGRIEINGVDVAQRSARQLSDFRLRELGFIFQSYNLIPVLTALENAEFTLMLQGVPKAERRSRVTDLFRQLGIAGLEDRRPNDLSGGQQQRVAIARAMAAKPHVILADEPTANLDSHTAIELLDLMRRLNAEQGITFIFSSHDQQVIFRARRVVRLKDGSLQSDSLGSAE